MFNRCTSNASTFIRAKAGFSGRFRLAGDPHSWKLHFHSEPEHEAEWGEDVVVRKVWWRLKHPETAARPSDPPKFGTVRQIIAECDVATSPWSSDKWLKLADAARAKGINVEAFEVERLNIRQNDLEG
jgi:hypothetical protein